ncbi:DUF2625 domain-containing protein [Massilia antarctica]|uniref:DUF2625 domain-containing protein n=1 Tax=Massilia antarctica TaxID=2765360 RepID=UPI00226E34CD|nr:DUF2625 domain-containing protein [Massilia sp. H27-R4]MCY0910389.1 DUF2625 domain-containing protein [Massilia sp. H27-R4]
MKQLHELINREEPGWLVVQQWLAEATNFVEVLPPPDDATRDLALLDTQVTTRSPMGAVIYESGGILVDHGWLRILASGHPRLPRSLPEWNFKRTFSDVGNAPQFLLVADDAVGGFFAIDGGGLSLEQGKVCYFAPDTLDWECMELSYSEFLVWCFGGDLARYYEDVRWPGWQDEMQEIRGDEAYSIYPFLSCGGPPIAERMRRAVPIAEIYALHVGALPK